MILTTIIFSIISSFVLTWLIRKLAIKKNIIDIPNQRSSHTTPTPRGGGLSFFLVWIASITILFLFNIVQSNLFFALICVLPIGIISIIDDVISLSPKIRLLVQILCAIAAIYFLGGIDKINLGTITIKSNIIIDIMAVISLIWFINLYNFLDGIDAYASMEAILVATGLFLLSGNPLLLIFIAPIAGFLYWNWPKAKIFMGDVGSTMLGFTLIILGIYYNNIDSVNLFYWLSLSSLFWFDATITLVRRKLNHENISQPHKKHAYQRITQAGFSHLKTSIIASIINILLILVVLGNKTLAPTIPYLSLIVAIAFNIIMYLLIEKLKPFK